jgi:hypothetical protein
LPRSRKRAQEIGIRYSSSGYSVFGILYLTGVIKWPVAGHTDNTRLPEPRLTLVSSHWRRVIRKVRSVADKQLPMSNCPAAIIEMQFPGCKGLTFHPQHPTMPLTQL